MDRYNITGYSTDKEDKEKSSEEVEEKQTMLEWLQENGQANTV